MNLVARNGKSQRSFVLLAPAGASDGAFREIVASREIHNDLIGQMQRLRGRIYLQDGAIQSSELTLDGRHVSSVDKDSWHLLTMNPDRKVMGCARFHKHPHSATYHKLTVSHASIARSPDYGAAVKEAIEAEMQFARNSELAWLEMGGWALAEELRGTTEALMYALATYAWSQLIGGAIGVSTVTERNGSAAILRRLGGQPLTWRGTPLPTYYDEHYRCTMELLRFDSRFPAPKYLSSIEALRCQILDTPVYCADDISERQPGKAVPKFSAQLAEPWMPISAAS